MLMKMMHEKGKFMLQRRRKNSIRRGEILSSGFNPGSRESPCTVKAGKTKYVSTDVG